MFIYCYERCRAHQRGTSHPPFRVGTQDQNRFRRDQQGQKDGEGENTSTVHPFEIQGILHRRRIRCYGHQSSDRVQLVERLERERSELHRTEFLRRAEVPPIGRAEMEIQTMGRAREPYHEGSTGVHQKELQRGIHADTPQSSDGLIGIQARQALSYRSSQAGGLRRDFKKTSEMRWIPSETGNSSSDSKTNR